MYKRQGAGIPFSDPISVQKALESFPDVPCVLAHAGSEMHNQQATYLAAKYDNVYLEPSWVGVIGVMNMVKRVGCSKIMFSSDNVYQIPVELAKYRSVIKNEDYLELSLIHMRDIPFLSQKRSAKNTHVVKRKGSYRFRGGGVKVACPLCFIFVLI